MKNFKELGLSEGMLNTIHRMDFEQPTKIQEKAIPLTLEGKDVIGGSATGSGKTLAFSSAIIENLKPNNTVQALILTPTRELAEQVANSIKGFSVHKKLNILSIYGGVNIENQIRQIHRTDIIVGTPGRILDHMNRRSLNLSNIKFLVLDEVDRMFDMGFYKDVETIIKYCPEKRQTMMFSATISGDIDHFVKKYTKDAKEVSVESYIDHSKLKQVYYDVSPNLKFSLLVHLLNKEKSELVIVFGGTRRNVDFIAGNLNKLKIHVQTIHGGLDQKKRIRALENFHKKSVGVLVCTDVAARGLDIKGVSHVYNYDLPSKSNDYIHRIGRTARAGKSGIVINILASRDYENFSNILKDSNLKITSNKLPYLERIRTIDFSNNSKRFNRGNSSRNFKSYPKRNHRRRY